MGIVYLAMGVVIAHQFILLL